MKRYVGLAVFVVFGGLVLWAFASYRNAGIIFALVDGTSHSDRSLEALRTYLLGWGPAGPVAYVLLVVVEVMVAPIPGTLLYAPGGAIFGPLMGGTLSLAGNVIGATLACLVAKVFGHRIAHTLDATGLSRYRARIVQKGGWVIFLLRVNPLTSSDLVSYAAGLVGVPTWKVAAGTFAGMAPLSYAQAYMADRILRVLPGSLWVVVGLGAAYLAIVIWILARGVRRSADREAGDRR